MEVTNLAVRLEAGDSLVLECVTARPDAHMKVAVHPDEDVAVPDVILGFRTLAGGRSGGALGNVTDADDRRADAVGVELLGLKRKAVGHGRHVLDAPYLPALGKVAKRRADARKLLVAWEAELDEPLVVEGAGHCLQNLDTP